MWATPTSRRTQLERRRAAGAAGGLAEVEEGDAGCDGQSADGQRRRLVHAEKGGLGALVVGKARHHEPCGPEREPRDREDQTSRPAPPMRRHLAEIVTKYQRLLFEVEGVRAHRLGILETLKPELDCPLGQ